jgi:enamine deaminase RidA (YjgF/YER057c/UK114 family)
MVTSESLIPSAHSRPIGKYSPGVLAGGLIFVSGQVATDAAGNVLGRGDAGAQAEIVFERIAQVLACAHADLSGLVQVTIYLVSLERDFPLVSGVRDRVLRDPAPASTLIEVSRLAEDGCLVEISGIALAGNGRTG